MRKLALIIGLLGLVLATAYGAPRDRGRYGGSAARPAPSPTTSSSSENYNIIVERNIFSRDRTPPRVVKYVRPTPPTTTTTSAPAPREVLLTGVALRDEVRVAFFEDSQTGSTLVLPAGSKLEKGMLVSISLDSVEFCMNGKTRKISIGETLSGTSVNAATFGGEVAGDTETASTQDSGPAGDNDVLRRMKARARAERHPRDKKP